MEPSKNLIAGPIKGYKAFNSDFTCLAFQFEVGQSYELPAGQLPILCKYGFHFCQIPIDCNQYYRKGINPRYAEIEAWNIIHGNDGKSVAGKIHIVREIPKREWDTLEGRFEGHNRHAYLMNGQFHREDGPAIERASGTKYWFQNGHLHREDGPAIEKADGSKLWYKIGKSHREDGPAIERANGTKAWYKMDKRHREDGPAIERADGTKKWYKMGKRHREEGPAIERADGTKEWYKMGKRHREDGPAIERADGTKEWYKNGRCYRLDILAK